jgi:hypothetical protein
MRPRRSGCCARYAISDFAHTVRAGCYDLGESGPWGCYRSLTRTAEWLGEVKKVNTLVAGEPHEPVDAAGPGQSLELVLASVFQPKAGAFDQARRRR